MNLSISSFASARALRLQLLHGVGRERRQQHHARRAMLGRIGGDRGRRNARRRRFAHDDAARGEMLGVVGDRAHVLVARGEVDAHEAVGMGDGARLAHLLPDREGVVDPARIEMIEIGGPVLDRRTRAHGFPLLLDDLDREFGTVGLGEVGLFLQVRQAPCRRRPRARCRTRRVRTAPARRPCSGCGPGTCRDRRGLCRLLGSDMTQHPPVCAAIAASWLT